MASEITQKHVDSYIEQLAKQTRYIANECFFIIKAVFKFGMRKGFVDHNPGYLLERPHKAKPRTRVFTNEEIRKRLKFNRFWKRIPSFGLCFRPTSS